MAETPTSEPIEADAAAAPEAFAPADASGAAPARAKAPELQLQKKQKRTLGLKLVDIGLYGILTNVSVFVISVIATHLTTHGDKYRGFGWMKERGDWIKGIGKKYFRLNEKQADDAKTVFFSWADGSIFALVQKPIEDRRAAIARWLDKKFGTSPEDESIYGAEPKRGWLSLIGGRLATVLVVVPTALFLEKVRWDGRNLTVPIRNYDSVEMDKKGDNLNDALFRKPGMDLGKKFTKRYKLPGVLGRQEIMDDIFRVGFFEAFYTVVCTAGQFLASHAIALFQGKRRNAKEVARTEHASPATAHEIPRPSTSVQHRVTTPPSTRQGGWRGGAERRERRPAERAETVAGRLEQREAESGAEAALAH